jgi:predicted RNA-binding Zn ribbon-like protein
MSITFEADDFPIIGEPLPVEFANSLYAAGPQIVDFLASPDLIQRWFTLATPDVDIPGTIRKADGDSIRMLRDAIHAIVTALAVGTTPTAETIAVLNRYAARAPWFLRLGRDDLGRLAATRQRTARPIDALLGRIANETIELVVSPSRIQLRQCNGPGCAMLFVKDHHKRRWCHQSCGHRARQANYYRRKRALVGAR